ncbi:NADH-quinone oxidoreductase subunit C [Guptibacillus algicola]|uniref:NADH-quinone oxidoreductase subunit C n=1 Tax=Guptibacillus algicola TaxID=225844 RepID=UPI001CD6F3DB|nr:NADH-quinone oxidoreductase subunit C [Alkalihalobacillus algicola]MCA0989007.1 NADH-quinone oxidoreductase subunit C [Alkalihalobacillus algicola]
MTDESRTDDLAEEKRKAVEEAKRKAAELRKAREEKKAEADQEKEAPKEEDADLAKKKAAAAAKAKAAALKKKKELEQAGGADEKAKAAAAARAKAEALKKKREKEAAPGEDTDADLAKKKAVAAAKAKAAALRKKKEQDPDEKAKAVAAAKAKSAALKKKSGTGDDEKAKAVAAAKAKAKAAAAAKAKAKEKEEEPEEVKPSLNQPILDRYLAIIRENLGDDLLEDAYINRLAKDVPTLVAKIDSYFKLAQFLKYNELLAFDYLSETHGTDFETHMEIYNHLYSYQNNQSVALKVKIDREKPVIQSITPLWTGANWPEREAFDLLGIVFEGHPNMTRIMMPDDWVGHPLRKDYEPYDVEV